MHTPTTATLPTDRQAGPSTSAGPALCRIAKGRRLTGQDALRFTADAIETYKSRSIHSICEETGRSYGAIHRLLTTSGVTMRPRGYQRKKLLSFRT